MAAGQGFKTFTTGEVLTAADVNGYLMQGVLVFASAAARDAAITSPQEGQFAYTKDNNSLWYYTGSAWAASGATGDIEGVTAGVGISGGGTSGTVTITNDMATTITASGDIVVGTGSGTYDNLPIGTTGQVLTADTTVSPYKVKWATPASGGITLLASGTLSGASVSLTSISQSYQDLRLVMDTVVPATSGEGIVIEVNGAGNNYFYTNQILNGAAGTQGNNSNILTTSGQGTSTQSMMIQIYNYTATTPQQWQSWGHTSDTSEFKRSLFGTIKAGAAITSIQMKMQDATNYSSGNYKLYGIK